jgi:hypothetical protein
MSVIAGANLANRLSVHSGILVLCDVALTKNLLEVLVHT